MREIELKVNIKDEEKILANLKKLGIKLGQPKTQHDVVYGQRANGHFIHGSNWLRVRTVDDKKHYFTLKRSVTGQMDSIERETTIGNPAEMALAIKDLGYELYSDITKTRRTAHYGKIEICYDKLPKLGTFIEVELLSPETADYDTVAGKLWELLTELGIKKSAEVTDGYDVLINKLEDHEI